MEIGKIEEIIIWIDERGNKTAFKRMSWAFSMQKMNMEELEEIICGGRNMQITDKERVMLESGKHKAVIRKEEVKQRVGDVAFEIDGIVYIIKEKKHWTLRRINSDRGTREFGCKTALQFRLMYNAIYDKYHGKSKEVYWLIVLKKDEKQKTLGGF